MNHNVIELRPYLPAQPAEIGEKPAVKNVLDALSVLVESVVTVGIGVCFVMGVVISLIIAL